ncbi:HAMP domain-containing sensor histidine kinase [Flaviaesturariibacter amylovorans]|uniref:histidine kinase n=1 Tax=Flaviaesturariibacter amylovorans TaxID=1084520 RepID=A0ABP8HSJ4_9BACT
MRIQTKIALLFTLLCMSILGGLSVAVYFFADARAFGDYYTRLELRANIAARLRFSAGTADAQAIETIRRQHLQILPEEQELILPFDSLAAYARPGSHPMVPPPVFAELQRTGAAKYRRGDRFFRGITWRTPTGNYAVVLSAVHANARDFLGSLRRILVAVNGVSMLLVLGVGLFFSRRILAPVRRITRQVNAINATSLHNRLSVGGGRDEVAELANTFNDLIARLEAAFETQRNFVSNASHELNTPLTAIIGEAELALMRSRSTAEYEAALGVVLSQAGRLREIIRSLLELAQSGFRGNLSFEPVELEELLRDVRRVAATIYPGCPVRFDLSLLPAPLNTYTLRGNYSLLELCLSNILLNACKYSAGKEVVLGLGATARQLVLIIRDQGIGIPAADIPFIFDPFFRASNVREKGGYGIGLPLSQNIIHLHKGSIQVDSREREGTEVVIRFPLPEGK